MSLANESNEQLLLEKLQSGLRRGDIRPHFQPEIDFSRSHWMGFEALSRWHDAEKGDISPAVFIPLAEKHGLLAELTCNQIQHLQRAAPELCQRFGDVALAFNLSPTLIGDGAIWEQLLTTRQATAHLPLTWEVEITESEPIDDFARAESQLSLLRQQGIKVVLDDFGTGWSNLVRVALLGVHRIKVDSVFVRNLQRPATLQVLQGVLNMTREMGLEITIEGVETPEQAMVLRQMGFERFQGWLYAKAMPLAEVLKFQPET